MNMLFGKRTSNSKQSAKPPVWIAMKKRRSVSATFRDRSSCSVAFSMTNAGISRRRRPSAACRSSTAGWSSATTKQLLHLQADITRDPAKQRGGNIAAPVEWYRRAATVGVPVLTVRAPLTGLDEAESFKQRRYLAWLENRQRTRHYAT
jgi:hypothetical protein